MTELLTATEMRAAETAAIAAGAAAGWAMMERAGRACAAAALEAWPRPGRAVVACGPGNNGGDGYVVATALAEAGWRAQVYALGVAERLPPDAAEARRRWLAAGGSEAPFAELGQAAPADLLVDALFGAGLQRGLDETVAGPLRAFDACGGAAATLAVDGPSGLCLDSGRPRGAVRAADLTVTFQRPKRGHYLGEGPALCGRLVVADIWIEGFVAAGAPAPMRLVAPAPDRLLKTGGHKYDHGHALVLAGGVGRGGAARLAARAALRVGAGLVTVAVPAAALIENAARLDAIMLRRCDGVEGLRALLSDARLNAVALGPGLGVGPETRALALAALEGGARAVVIDADALTSFAEAERDAFFAALAGAPAVLTPHWGEFGRLFPEIAVAAKETPARGPLVSRADAAQRAAEACGATVLLKGPDTVIATPGQPPLLNAAVRERAAPGLATAGAGDVLAGLICGLMARGVAPRDAAAGGAWLHVEAARRFGPGLIAEDLPETIPAVLRALVT